MANMSKVKVAMPEQDPKVRARNFQEVTLGYTPEMAIEEAGRCLGCKNPLCVQGCPVNVRIPEFIGHVQKGDFKAAYEVITFTPWASSLVISLATMALGSLNSGMP